VSADRFVSKGLTRGRVGKDTKLMLITSPEETSGGAVQAMQTSAASAMQTVTALKTDSHAQTLLEPELGKLELNYSGQSPAPARSAEDMRLEAQMKGYAGEACPECQNFTLVRNGTCLKCDTCGSTTGCS